MISNEKDAAGKNLAQDSSADGGKSWVGLFSFFSVVCLAAGLYLRTRTPDLLLSIRTHRFSGHLLFDGYPPNGEAVVFNSFASAIIKDSLGSFIPSAFFFALAIYLAVKSFSFIDRPMKRISDSLGEAFEKNRMFFFTAGIVLLNVIFALAKNFIFGDRLFSFDEFGYIFQAHVLDLGKLYLKSPQPIDSFCANTIVNNGRWFSRYTIGWPLILAPFVAFGVPWLANFVLGALSVLVTFLVGEKLYGRKAGALAGVILLVSPFFLMNCLTNLNHVSHLFTVLLFLMFFFQGVSADGRWFQLLLAGLCLGFAFMIRPTGAVVMGGVFFLLALWKLYRAGDLRRELLFRYAFGIGGFAVMVLVTLLVNKIQTDSFLVFAFSKYNPGEGIGFGVFNHNLIRGLWNTLFSVGRLPLWLPVLSLSLSVVALWDNRSENYGMFSVIVGLVFMYIFYYSLGNVELGPRYYFLMMAVIPLLCARGVFIAARFLSPSLPVNRTVSIFLVFNFLFLLTVIYPPIIHRTLLRLGQDKDWMVARMLREKVPSGKKALVFIRTSPRMRSGTLVLNYPPLEGKRFIYVLFLDPQKNDEVRATYPDRVKMIVNYDEQTQRFSVMPDYKIPFEKRSRETRITDLSAAGYHYALTVKDLDSAILMFNWILRENPKRYDVVMQKAATLMDQKRFKQSISLLIQSARNEDSPGEIFYLMGTCYYKLGMNKEALNAFRYVPKKGGEGIMRKKAYFWIKYLEGLPGKAGQVN